MENVKLKGNNPSDYKFRKKVPQKDNNCTLKRETGKVSRSGT